MPMPPGLPRPPAPRPPPGPPPPPGEPMPPPQGEPPGMSPGAPAMPPGPPGMPSGQPPMSDPGQEQNLAQAELLSRLEQLDDRDLHTIQHGIDPKAVAVLKKVIPELGAVLDMIEEGAQAAQDEMGDSDGYDEGDEQDEGSPADEADDESKGEAEEPDEAVPPPGRPRTKLGQM